MGDSFDISDPSDWLLTPMPLLAPVESALRCQICKDFYDTPMITTCSHTFCSLCIRRCLTTDGKCPACRAPDQELKLRRNGTVQELVDVFKGARHTLMQVGKDLRIETGSEQRSTLKRKMENSDFNIAEETDERCTRRKTRAQDTGTLETQQIYTKTLVDASINPILETEDSLQACPICQQKMKEEEVFSHLDIHIESDDPKDVIPISPNNSSAAQRRNPSSKPPEKLPQLSYSLLKDNALRKKLVELGIPSGGSRAQLIRRHTEWVNLVNANRDSSRPRTKRELIHDLDVWDRIQGRSTLNGSAHPTNASSIMRKDFDGAAWGAIHNDEFQRLITDARQKAKDQNMTKIPSDIESNSDPQQAFKNLNSSVNGQKENAKSISSVATSKIDQNLRKNDENS